MIARASVPQRERRGSCERRVDDDDSRVFCRRDFNNDKFTRRIVMYVYSIYIDLPVQSTTRLSRSSSVPLRGASIFSLLNLPPEFSVPSANRARRPSSGSKADRKEERKKKEANDSAFSLSRRIALISRS